jgi:ubiquinone/menaquinone biosynthesis C-methylase UbiE
VSALDRLHQRLVSGRRVRVLSQHLAALLPEGASVLDVGAGDGLVARAVMQRRPDVEVRGCDVLLRPNAGIPVEQFDGTHIPHGDQTFDAVMLVDVLHHTTAPSELLHEAARVARRAVIIKDHLADARFAALTLRFMDRVGNARFGVALPFHYWRRAEWYQAFAEARLSIEVWREQLALYPPIASAIFDRSLHMLARLRPR